MTVHDPTDVPEWPDEPTEVVMRPLPIDPPRGSLWSDTEAVRDVWAAEGLMPPPAMATTTIVFARGEVARV